MATGSYNLPDWDETPLGFQQMLLALFKVSPPTAMIVDESPLFSAVQQFVTRPQQSGFAAAAPRRREGYIALSARDGD